MNPAFVQVWTTWARNFSALAMLGAVGYIGETGADGGFIKDLWAQAKTAGTFGCLFATLAWLDERRERKRSDERLYDRTVAYTESTNRQTSAGEKGVDALREMADAMRSMSDKIKPRRRR